MFGRKYQFVTVGGATRDFMFYDPKAKFLFTPENVVRQKSLCFEYGAKIQVDETYITFGGGGANSAVNLASLGFKVATLTAVGDDDNGHQIINNFQKRGVDISLIQKEVGKLSGFSFILTAGKEKEHVIFLYRGANDYLKCSHELLSRFKTRWFYVASLSGKKWQEVLDCVFSARGYKAWNPGVVQLRAGYSKMRKYLERTKVLALNKDEAVELVVSMVKEKENNEKINDIKYLLWTIKTMGPEIVLITSGREGAAVYDGKKYHQEKLKNKNKEAVDTTGVGDCFDSTFVAGLEKYNGDIQKSLKAAMDNSSSLVTKVGAQNGLKKIF